MVRTIDQKGVFSSLLKKYEIGLAGLASVQVRRHVVRITDDPTVRVGRLSSTLQKAFSTGIDCACFSSPNFFLLSHGLTINETQQLLCHIVSPARAANVCSPPRVLKHD